MGRTNGRVVAETFRTYTKIRTETGGPTSDPGAHAQSTHKRRSGKSLSSQTRRYVLRFLCEERKAQISSLVPKIVVRMRMREHEGPTCGRRTKPSSSLCRTKGRELWSRMGGGIAVFVYGASVA